MNQRLLLLALLAFLALCQGSKIYRVKTLLAPKSSESDENGGRKHEHKKEDDSESDRPRLPDFPENEPKSPLRESRKTKRTKILKDHNVSSITDLEKQIQQNVASLRKAEKEVKVAVKQAKKKAKDLWNGLFSMFGPSTDEQEEEEDKTATVTTEKPTVISSSQAPIQNLEKAPPVVVSDSICNPNPCKNDGICRKMFGKLLHSAHNENNHDFHGYTCQCKSAFTGFDCELNSNFCIPNPCQNGGQCSLVHRIYKRAIDQNQKDPLYAKFKVYNQSLKIPSNFSCICASGFKGRTCDEGAILPIVPLVIAPLPKVDPSIVYTPKPISTQSQKDIDFTIIPLDQVSMTSSVSENPSPSDDELPAATSETSETVSGLQSGFQVSTSSPEKLDQSTRFEVPPDADVILLSKKPADKLSYEVQETDTSTPTVTYSQLVTSSIDESLGGAIIAESVFHESTSAVPDQSITSSGFVEPLSGATVASITSSVDESLGGAIIGEPVLPESASSIADQQITSSGLVDSLSRSTVASMTSLIDESLGAAIVTDSVSPNSFVAVSIQPDQPVTSSAHMKSLSGATIAESVLHESTSTIEESSSGASVDFVPVSASVEPLLESVTEALHVTSSPELLQGATSSEKVKPVTPSVLESASEAPSFLAEIPTVESLYESKSVTSSKSEDQSLAGATTQSSVRLVESSAADPVVDFMTSSEPSPEEAIAKLSHSKIPPTSVTILPKSQEGASRTVSIDTEPVTSQPDFLAELPTIETLYGSKHVTSSVEAEPEPQGGATTALLPSRLSTPEISRPIEDSLIDTTEISATLASELSEQAKDVTSSILESLGGAIVADEVSSDQPFSQTTVTPVPLDVTSSIESLKIATDHEAELSSPGISDASKSVTSSFSIEAASPEGASVAFEPVSAEVTPKADISTLVTNYISHYVTSLSPEEIVEDATDTSRAEVSTPEALDASKSMALSSSTETVSLEGASIVLEPVSAEATSKPFLSTPVTGYASDYVTSSSPKRIVSLEAEVSTPKTLDASKSATSSSFFETESLEGASNTFESVSVTVASKADVSTPIMGHDSEYVTSFPPKEIESLEGATDPSRTEVYSPETLDISKSLTSSSSSLETVSLEGANVVFQPVSGQVTSKYGISTPLTGYASQYVTSSSAIDIVSLEGATDLPQTEVSGPKTLDASKSVTSSSPIKTASQEGASIVFEPVSAEVTSLAVTDYPSEYATSLSPKDIKSLGGAAGTELSTPKPEVVFAEIMTSSPPFDSQSVSLEGATSLSPDVTSSPIDAMSLEGATSVSIDTMTSTIPLDGATVSQISSQMLKFLEEDDHQFTTTTATIEQKGECMYAGTTWDFYDGHLNKTLAGRYCLPWDWVVSKLRVDFRPWDGVRHNFCRNPDRNPKGPWCFYQQPDGQTARGRCVRRCSAADHQCVHDDDLMQNYDHRYSRTANGRKCQPWAQQSPHQHPSGVALANASNFCRNPDGSEGGPWCFTLDIDVRREHCLPPCFEYD